MSANDPKHGSSNARSNAGSKATESAALNAAPNATELALGMRGVLPKGITGDKDDSFELVGRAHVASRGGGRWNEWRAIFASGREGWLAEAAARFYFMFEGPLLDVDSPPPGGLVNARWVIGERDFARRIAAFGDVPVIEDEVDYRYIDLSGADGRVGTVDYGESVARTFVGQRVTLSEVGLSSVGEPTYAKFAKGDRPESASTREFAGRRDGERAGARELRPVRRG